MLPPKTILIAMYGQGKTRGQSAVLEIPATTNHACFAILPYETWEPDFLHLWLKASYKDLRDLSENRGGNQANLNGALLNALEVPAPSKTEQQHMVARLQAAMTEIDALENSSKATLEDINRLPNRVLGKPLAKTEITMTEKRIAQQHHATFEGIRQSDDSGADFWLARDCFVIIFSCFTDFTPKQ